MADPIARQPEQRRDKGAQELQGAEHGERQPRAGRHQHEPAQDHAFHLECPGSQQIGRPLEAETADLKRRQRRHTRGETHVLFVPSPVERLVRAPRGLGTVRAPGTYCNYRVDMAASPIAGLLQLKPYILWSYYQPELVNTRLLC